MSSLFTLVRETTRLCKRATFEGQSGRVLGPRIWRSRLFMATCVRCTEPPPHFPRALDQQSLTPPILLCGENDKAIILILVSKRKRQSSTVSGRERASGNGRQRVRSEETIRSASSILLHLCLSYLFRTFSLHKDKSTKRAGKKRKR
jgi:hypothetical protein